MDVDDWGFPTHGTTTFDYDNAKKNERNERYIQKDNRYTNLSLWITEDYLFLTSRRRFRHGTERLEDFCIFYTRVEKSKINPYPDFPGTRY